MLGDSFKLASTKSMPFIIREHQRKNQVIVCGLAFLACHRGRHLGRLAGMNQVVSNAKRQEPQGRSSAVVSFWWMIFDHFPLPPGRSVLLPGMDQDQGLIKCKLPVGQASAAIPAEGDAANPCRQGNTHGRRPLKRRRLCEEGALSDTFWAWNAM